MVDAEFVAFLYSVEQLQKDILDETVLSDVSSTFCDHGKEITLWAMLHDDVDVGEVVDDAVESDDVWMM